MQSWSVTTRSPASFSHFFSASQRRMLRPLRMPTFTCSSDIPTRRFGAARPMAASRFNLRVLLCALRCRIGLRMELASPFRRRSRDKPGISIFCLRPEGRLSKSPLGLLPISIQHGRRMARRWRLARTTSPSDCSTWNACGEHAAGLGWALLPALVSRRPLPRRRKQFLGSAFVLRFFHANVARRR